MANERTFFKYLFSAFHLGAMGTFLLTYFSRRDEYKLLLVIMTWVTAFSFIFWGLWAYYHRKTLMNDGKIKVRHVMSHLSLFFLLICLRRLEHRFLLMMHRSFNCWLLSLSIHDMRWYCSLYAITISHSPLLFFSSLVPSPITLVHSRCCLQDTSYLNPHGPAYVFFMFLLIFACILAYAIVTRQYPGKHSPLRMPNGRIMPIPSTLLGDG